MQIYETNKYCALGLLLKSNNKSINYNGFVTCIHWLGQSVSKQIEKLNDYERLSLPQIADWVEENL
jgi:hypothetical protein